MDEYQRRATRVRIADSAGTDHVSYGERSFSYLAAEALPRQIIDAFHDPAYFGQNRRGGPTG